MNTIKITLLNDGTTARIDKDFAVYKNSYRNVLIDIYVPTSILNLSLGYTHSVKIGAERTASNGAETTTKSYYVDYKATETIANVEYYVFERLLPREFVEIAGNETIVTNVVLFDNSSLTEIITSENVILQIQDSNYILDDEIEDDDTVAEIESDITDLQERVGEIETDLYNETTSIEARLTEAEHNIQENTEDIAELRNQIQISETFIGTYENIYNPENVTTQMLNNFVDQHAHREPRTGDVIIYIWVKYETDQNYKFIYSELTGWNYYELPPMEKASNNNFGIVKGTSYGSQNNIYVNIIKGEFAGISVKNLTTNQYSSLDTFLNSLYEEQQGIKNGTIAVGLANKAVNDGNGNNIANTYLTQNAGATKQYVQDYALPKEFYQTYFIDSSGYVDEPPTEPVSGVQFTKETSAVGEFEIFDISRTDASPVKLTAKNSAETTIYISANQNTTFQLKLTNYAQKQGENAKNLSIELSNEITLTSGEIYKIDFQSNFNELVGVLELESGDNIGQILSVVTQETNKTTFSVISNEVYPSSYTMNTQSLVIITQQGNLGEIPVYDLTGTITGTQIDFSLGTNQVYANTLARFILRVSEQTQLPYNYTLNLVYGGQNVRLATPYNYLSGNVTIQDLKQANITFDAVNGTVIDFIGYINIDSGDNITVYLNEDKVNDVYYCTFGQTTTTEIAEAINKGKLPVVIYNGRTYIYTHGTYYFDSVNSNVCYELSVSSPKTWSYNSFTFEKSTNKVTSLSSSSTDTQYPSAKAVYDVLQERALNSAVVHKTGNEDIYGLKAFDIRPKVGIEGTLPTGYERIEYVQSTNGQYINTGYTTHSIGKAKMQISFDDVINDQWLLGYQMNVGGSLSHEGYDIFVALESGELKYKITTVEAYVAGNPIRTISSGLTPTVDTVYDIETEIIDYNQYIKIDGVTLGTSTYKLDTQGVDATLFKANGVGTKLGQIKLYSCKLYNVNGDLIRDYVPCKRATDNEIGLYDFVQGVFFPSLTTSFVGGSAVTPTDDNYVMLKGDIEANPTLDGTESNLTSIEIKGIKHKVLQPNWGNIGGTLSSQTDLQNALNAKSTVSVSSTGTATDEVSYITINGVEKKIAGNGGGGGGSGSVEGLPLGFIFSSALPQTNLNYHLLNGDSLAITDYSDFYTLLTTLVGQSWNLTCTANEYAEDIAKTGNCGKFVINSTSSDVTGTYDTTTITVTANSFKLPTITRFIQGLSSLSNLGESVEAGLPNITGGISPNVTFFTSKSAYGAFEKYEGNVLDGAHNSGSSTASFGYTLDASRSSAIYGNSNTVQPQATYYPYYMVVKNNNTTGVMNYLQELAQAGVQSLGGAVGDITLGNGLKMQNNVLDTSFNINFNLQDANITSNIAGGKISYIELGNIVIVQFNQVKLANSAQDNGSLLCDDLPLGDFSKGSAEYPTYNQLTFQINWSNILNSSRTGLRMRITNNETTGKAEIYTNYTASANYKGDSQEVCGIVIYQKAVN